MPSAGDSGRFFRHAERRAREFASDVFISIMLMSLLSGRERVLYSYSASSPSSSRSPSPSKSHLPLSERIAAMKQNLAILEAEAAHDAGENDEPTELMRELSGMRGRLAGVSGRSRLISAVVNGKQKAKLGDAGDSQTQNVGTHDAEPRVRQEAVRVNESNGTDGGHGVVDMDKRIAQLEKLIGSSGTSLDEVNCHFLCYDLLAAHVYLYIVVAAPSAASSSPHTNFDPVNAPYSTSTYRLHLPSTQAPLDRS